MAKFNRSATVEKRLSEHPSATTNHEGGLAFDVDPETQLYLRSCVSLLENKFYTNADTHLAETRALIQRCDRRFVLQLANYVRNRMHLRSMPVMLLAEASVMQAEAREPKADVRQYVPRIVRRADEPMELVSYWLANLGGGAKSKFPNALRKGLSDALARWDEYQLAKYNRSGTVTLKDVLNLAHPKPADAERSALYRRILDGALATPDTWEVAISGKGSTAENWDAIAPEMGIFALLRNLRNFEQKGAEKALSIAVEKFTDADAVRNSKLLPFRWYQAHQHVTRSNVRDAILGALDLSLECVEPWTGTTAILVDTSGSMDSNLSEKGVTKCVEVAALLGAMATALSPHGYHVGRFDSNFRWVPNISRRDSVLTNMKRIMRDYGGATYAYKALETMRLEKVRVDRIVMLSDMQCYNERSVYGSGDKFLAAEWEKYRREINPNAYLYSIDLAGYGTSQFIQGDPHTVLLAGWSEQVLDFVRHYENGRTAVDEIKANW